MSIPAFVRKAFPDPLPLEDAIELMEASDEVPETSKAALKSAAIDAVRHATRDRENLPSKAEALRTDVRPLLSVLPAAARAAAEARNHQQPGDHEGRGRRFVEFLTGGRSVDRSRLRFPCPPAWQPLVDAIPDRKNANGEMSFLHRCCMVAGYQDAPARMPSYDQLVEAARQINGDVGVRRARKASMPQYRTARQRLIDAAPEEERDVFQARFAALPTAASPRTCHLGVEPATIELLKATDDFEPEMTPEEMFKALAPGLAADYEYWVNGAGTLLSASFREQCQASLLRVCGWIVRAGHGAHLREIQLPDLFLREIRLGGAVVVNPRLARRLNDHVKEGTTVSLLEAAAESEAAASLERSTVTDAELAGVDKDGRPWFTEAMHSNCSRIWTMTGDIYREMAARGGEAAKEWALVESRWGRLQNKLTSRKLPPRHRVLAKNKLLLVQTVTLPQLVCVGVPLRRREVRGLRAEWLAAVQQAKDAEHANPHAHPEVVRAANQYFEAALPLTILCLAIDDGLRRQQYTRGRLGNAQHFRVELELDAEGKPTGILSVTTHWTGDKRDPAHLKIDNKNNVMTRRENRIVRRGFVDHVVLWDLVRYWRPAALAANGEVPDLAGYDLAADLRAGRYALFPSNRKVPRKDKSRTDIGDIFGKELHYIVRRWLRPSLPAWDDLGPEWRGLWAIHISRLLIGSYWGGARDDWRTAMYLTMDTETTLRGEYSEVDDGLRDRLGPDRTDWEHLNAYDPWMDRLYYHHEEFDPLEDPDLPLPPHLQGRLPKDETSLPKKRRIRRARPGQKPPKTRT